MSLIILCPITSKPIRTAISVDFRALAANWNKRLRVACPYCNRSHHIKLRDAFIKMIVSTQFMHDVRTGAPPRPAHASTKPLRKDQASGRGRKVEPSTKERKGAVDRNKH